MCSLKCRMLAVMMCASEHVDFSAADKHSDVDDLDLFEELERELKGGWVLCVNGGWKS